MRLLIDKYIKRESMILYNNIKFPAWRESPVISKSQPPICMYKDATRIKLFTDAVVCVPVGRGATWCCPLGHAGVSEHAGVEDGRAQYDRH